MPRAFDKLHHQHLEPLAGGPHGRSERRRRLAFPRPRVDDDQALSRFGHSRPPVRFSHANPVLIADKDTLEVW